MQGMLIFVGHHHYTIISYAHTDAINAGVPSAAPPTVAFSTQLLLTTEVASDASTGIID